MVEKVDLKTLFLPVCEFYGVPITNTRGWNDINSRAAMMRRFQEHEEAGRRCALLYCGDHDPGGLAISGSIKSNLEDISQAIGWRLDNLLIERFGLNADFIERERLSWIENLETSSGGRLDDPNHRDFRLTYVQDYLRHYGARKVEANALVVRPQAARELCRLAISKYFDAYASDMFDHRLARERKAVRELLPALAATVFGGTA